MNRDPASPTFHRIELEPVGRRVDLEAGQTLLDAVRSSGIEMVAVCGGDGRCCTCLVRALTGRLSDLTQPELDGLTAEQRTTGYRLACQATPLSDVKLEIPPDSMGAQQRLQLEGEEIEQALAPLVVAIDVTTAPATLEDVRADATRLQDAAASGGSQLSLPHSVLREMSGQLRAQGWSARLGVRRPEQDGRSWEVVAVTPVGAPLLGLAADIGTTKIAAYLVDLATGRTLAKAGAVNPQIAYGEDVISRIAYANAHADGRAVLQAGLAETLNRLVAELCAETGATPSQVADAVVVGNTAMHHLFAGLPVRQLGQAPYVPAISGPLDVPARDLGLVLAPGAYVHLPPNIAGFVGADHVAMALAAGAWDPPARTLVAVDIGTNTEVTVRKGDRIWCCSCASGPAFEGAHIRDGMRAAPGAIERVQITGGRPQVKTIGGRPPVGICGSGILDAVSELLRIGAIDRRGALVVGASGVTRENDALQYVLAPADVSGHGRPIIVTRKDVTEVQLAKAAIRAGVETLLAEAELGPDDIETFIVAGAFGTYLDVASTVRTGLFPSLPLARFSQVGNAAGGGARQMLISAGRRAFAAQRARDVTYVELTVHPGFSTNYMKALSFDPSLAHGGPGDHA